MTRGTKHPPPPPPQKKRVNKGAPATTPAPVILEQKNHVGYKFFTTALQTLLKPRTMQWKDWNNES